MNPTIKSILHWGVPLLIPIVLLLTTIRIVMTPFFVQLEYRMPNFPEDIYGFTLEDRLKWAPLAFEYPLNNEDISFLGDLKDNNGNALYTDRELGHMQDVKSLVKPGLAIWYTLALILILLGVWARRTGWWDDYQWMISAGGKLTAGLLGALIFLILLNFDSIFTGFHRIFFEGNTWLFYYDDTLIRLFPMRFWQDSFLIIGALTLIAGISLWYFFGRVFLPKSR